ncbi:hypothetical protein OK351_07035 [Glutamicibacter sp. MNS18]|uniref:hypothetical protein n=1 Tax=Glutamicibacter sp. MNS18 TaxID=2989817 RepID=UPI0022356903|nr:hypothetical protein [Glutamicibacter sp. MNS18]MCW4465255.1 hypothetical protein [Glutamicibacter sp. MNS18]
MCPTPEHPPEQNNESSPDSPAGSTYPAPNAATIPVHHGDLLLTGWVIKTDTVLVRAGGLNGQTEVSVGDRRVKVEDIFEMTRGIDGWEPLSALQLPQGTLQIKGEAFPPGIEPPGAPGMPATYAFWCRLFPRVRGC